MSSLPNHIISGMDFKSSTVNTINALIDYCKSHELHGDNRTVRINQTPSGVTLTAIPQPSVPASSGGGGYNGPFRVVQTDTYKVTVKGVDDFTMPRPEPGGGSVATGRIAGFFLHGNKNIPVAEMGEAMTVMRDTPIITVLMYYNTSGQLWYPSYGAAPLQNYQRGYAGAIPLAYVRFSGYAIEKIIQLQYGNITMGGTI